MLYSSATLGLAIVSELNGDVRYNLGIVGDQNAMIWPSLRRRLLISLTVRGCLDLNYLLY